mgnify:CR=1 FL=1
MTDLDQDLPEGLRTVAQHARELSHAPVHERMQRVGRERLMMSALHARPLTSVRLELRWIDVLLQRFSGVAAGGAIAVAVMLGIGIAGYKLWQGRPADPARFRPFSHHPATPSADEAGSGTHETGVPRAFSRSGYELLG